MDPADQRVFLEREAAALSAFAANPGFQFGPQFIEFDSCQRLLMTVALEGYCPLDRVLRRNFLSDPLASIAAAAALANLHEALHEVPALDAQMLDFPLAPILPFTPEEFVTRPADYSLLAAALHRSRNSVEKLASNWRPSHFIHGDFKADNLLVRVDPRFKDRPSTIIVDWEMAGFGDPMWDVGSYIGSILLVWIQILGSKAASEEALASHDANSVRRQVGYFLLTHRHMAPGVFEATDSFALTAFQYAGMFMLHRVAVGLDINGFMDPVGSMMLDFARSLLDRPEAAAAALLAGIAL